MKPSTTSILSERPNKWDMKTRGPRSFGGAMRIPVRSTGPTPLVGAVMSLLLVVPAALASDASTSASASSPGAGPGTAAASAQYSGDRGFAGTHTRSGLISFGRGVAFGVDQDGISFSASYAVAGSRGPAVASSLNISIGRDGQVSRSLSRSIAGGSLDRQVSVGGFSSVHRANTAAGATASGRTGQNGFVRAFTQTRTMPPSVQGRWPRRSR